MQHVPYLSIFESILKSIIAQKLTAAKNNKYNFIRIMINEMIVVVIPKKSIILRKYENYKINWSRKHM